MSRKCLETTPGRLSLESFLSAHASEGLTLEIGAEDSECARWFPNRVAINIRRNEHVDVMADAYRLPFGDEAFDVVLCAEVLEHLHTPSVALAEMRRVLKPEGKLLLTTPFAYPIHYAPTDYYRYTRYGLLHLLADWEVESLTEATTDGAALATFFHHWLLKKKGVAWKAPKLAWWCVWRALTRSYRGGMKRAGTNGNTHMPGGYLVAARKRAAALSDAHEAAAREPALRSVVEETGARV
ncbi:MAG: methyltransferase domain-containing protein [Pyrinomonadaceae bacterium]